MMSGIDSDKGFMQLLLSTNENRPSLPPFLDSHRILSYENHLDNVLENETRRSRLRRR